MMKWLRHHRTACMLAIRRLVTAPLNTLLALITIGIALALPATGQMLLSNALQLARHNSAPTPQISLFTHTNSDGSLNQDIETSLLRNPAIRSSRFVSRDDTLARMKANEGLADVIDALPRNPFPDTFLVMPADESPDAVEQLAEELKSIPGIQHVQLDSAWVRRLDAMLKLGRASVLLLSALLGIGLVAITFNTIRAQVLANRGEIEVSRLLGATDNFIRRPFQYFGALQGLAGGITAWAIVAGTTWLLRDPISELATLYNTAFSLHPLSEWEIGRAHV